MDKATADSWAVVVALLKEELGVVVGMHSAIDDDNAAAFALAFYAYLAADLPIDEAVTSGRIAIGGLDQRA